MITLKDSKFQKVYEDIKKKIAGNTDEQDDEVVDLDEDASDFADEKKIKDKALKGVKEKCKNNDDDKEELTEDDDKDEDDDDGDEEVNESDDDDEDKEELTEDDDKDEDDEEVNESDDEDDTEDKSKKEKVPFEEAILKQINKLKNR